MWEILWRNFGYGFSSWYFIHGDDVLSTWSVKWTDWPPKVMKQIQKWNTSDMPMPRFELGGCDLWSNVLPTIAWRRPWYLHRLWRQNAPGQNIPSYIDMGKLLAYWVAHAYKCQYLVALYNMSHNYMYIFIATLNCANFKGEPVYCAKFPCLINHKDKTSIGILELSLSLSIYIYILYMRLFN